MEKNLKTRIAIKAKVVFGFFSKEKLKKNLKTSPPSLKRIGRSLARSRAQRTGAKNKKERKEK